MPMALLLGLGAGLVSAVVFASATTGPAAMRLLLFFITALPIYIVGLALGWRAALAATASGLVALSLIASPGTGLMFAATEGLPAVVLVYLATLYRSSGPVPGPGGDIEWYPVGRIVLWSAVIGAVLAVITMLRIGGDREALLAGLKTMIGSIVKKEVSASGLPVPLADADLTRLAETVIALLPAFSAASWMGGHLLNLWLGARVTRASGHLVRPWADLAAFHLPPMLPLALGLATAASFADGNLGLVASAYSGGLFFAYTLLGLAIVHYTTRGKPWRPFALSTLYAGIVVLSAALPLALTLVGLFDSIRPLRRLPSGVGPPPGAPRPPDPPTGIV